MVNIINNTPNDTKCPNPLKELFRDKIKSYINVVAFFRQAIQLIKDPLLTAEKKMAFGSTWLSPFKFFTVGSVIIFLFLSVTECSISHISQLKEVNTVINLREQLNSSSITPEDKERTLQLLAEYEGKTENQLIEEAEDKLRYHSKEITSYYKLFFSLITLLGAYVFSFLLGDHNEFKHPTVPEFQLHYVFAIAFPSNLMFSLGYQLNFLSEYYVLPNDYVIPDASPLIILSYIYGGFATIFIVRTISRIYLVSKLRAFVTIYFSNVIATVLMFLIIKTVIQYNLLSFIMKITNLL